MHKHGHFYIIYLYLLSHIPTHPPYPNVISAGPVYPQISGKIVKYLAISFVKSTFMSLDTA